jgi:tRNA threonylcarbamoyladenosine biosynthesis protein TsaE
MHEAVASPFISFTLSDLAQVAQNLLQASKNAKIWLFHGDLGAGKTTLIKELCIQLGVQSANLSSPTFSIINEYDTATGRVFHFDFYRMKNENEILDLGVDEYFESGSYCFIEWPDRLGAIAPIEYFKVILTHSGHNSRLLEFENHG